MQHRMHRISGDGDTLRPCAGKTIEEMKRDIGTALYHRSKVDTAEQRLMFSSITAMW